MSRNAFRASLYCSWLSNEHNGRYRSEAWRHHPPLALVFTCKHIHRRALGDIGNLGNNLAQKVQGGKDGEKVCFPSQPAACIHIHYID